jgi:hypothetical protein
MKYLRKLGLILSAVAFCMSFYVASANAQRRGQDWRDRDRGDSYRDGQRFRRRQEDRFPGGYRRSRNRFGRFGISPWEYRRLRRARFEPYRDRNRFNRYDYMRFGERRRIRPQYRYRRNW